MATEKYIKNYINGALVPAISGKYLDNLNPAKGKVYSYLPDCGAPDLEAAVIAAENAFSEWSAVEPERRFRILMRIADIMEQDLQVYARTESIDTGRPMNMTASMDIPRAQASFRYFATAAMHFGTQSTYHDKYNLQVGFRQPLGIVACIVGWHLPIYQLCRNIAPALATGNCVIAKSAQWTPMTAYLFAKACAEVGLPDGVLNIIHGEDESLSELIINHPKISAVTYEGDTATAEKMAQQNATHFKKLSITIGGNNPCILFADCDFDQMIVEVLRASFSNNGQLHHHTSRLLVERSLYDRFKPELVKRTQFLKIGDPFSTITDIGAVISAAQIERIKSYLTLAEVEGGNLLCGGKPVEMAGEMRAGYFWRPAVIEGLDNNSKWNQEPVVAPAVSIQTFDTLEEVIALANTTQYGLSASIWSGSSVKANRVAEQLKARTIWINSWLTDSQTLPSGGKIHSNFGMGGGMASMQFFTEAKHVSLQF